MTGTELSMLAYLTMALAGSPASFRRLIAIVRREIENRTDMADLKSTLDAIETGFVIEFEDRIGAEELRLKNVSNLLAPSIAQLSLDRAIKNRFE